MHFRQTFDRIAMSEVLPAPAFAIYRSLVDQHDLRRAAARVLPPQEGLDVLADVQAAWGELQRLETALSRGTAEENAVAQQRRKYADLRAEYDRRTALQEQAREALFPIARLLERIDRFIADEVQAGRKHFEIYTGAPLKLKKGERARDAVERARAERQEHLSILTQVRHAPRPVDESLAIVREYIARWADRGRLSVFDLVERRDAISSHGSPYSIPSDRHAPPISVPMFAPTTLAASLNDDTTAIIQGQLPDFGAMIAWLHPEVLLEKLEAEIRATTDESAALSTDERNARIKDLHGLIVGAERLEEVALRAAIADGDTIDRRPDATPFVVLGLEIAAPARHLTIEQ